MKELEVKDAAKELGILPDSVRHAIKRGAIAATKNFQGHYLISESEIKRRQEEKCKLNDSKYYTGKNIEKLGFSAEILHNGTLETIKIGEITVAEREEIIRFITDKESRRASEEEILFSQSIIVGLRYGIDIDVSLDICKICGNYLYKSKIKTNLICKGKKWKYRGPFGDTVIQLVLKEIKKKDVIKIETIGIESQAKELNDFLARVILDIRA